MGTPLEFLKGRPSKARPKAVETPAAELAQEAAPEPARPAKPARPPESAVLAADRAETLRRERSLIDDAHRIHIPGTRWTYLQLVTPIDEWLQVRLHEQLRVGFDDGGIPVFRSFVSPRDFALGGPDADDPVEERTLRDGGFRASEKLIGVAAELVRTGAGFELATRLENGVELPNVGLIVQARTNFYRPLRAYRSREDKVIGARKRGTGKDTAYEFAVACEAIEIPAGLAPDLDAFLHSLADEGEMRAVLDSLPDGWQLVRRPRW